MGFALSPPASSPATRAVARPALRINAISQESAMNRIISPQAWKLIAKTLGVDEACLKAVAEVESSGGGFMRSPSQLPKILFEGHVFHRRTKGRFGASHPGLSYPRWDRSKYSGSMAGEWKRLDAASALDRVAALESASWGAFQIMGFNYAACGFDDVDAFVAAHKESADAQLAAFARFISRPKFLDALRGRNWKGFAAAYNGPEFAKNRYDTKLATAYARFAAQSQ
ncbi:N-acetylmuramidase family protein [Lysobacter capsici]|uniref:N-acetylmuramidase family protein n=1 Tax=Lysobacter capsici TaxID=435897 RepID=UPI00287B5FF6|nr:N-acetylmuramidase family protein [Lysobacter capsici]WND78635.1 N-acetylmuramidase family protein [Lysobacter capsici]WND83830.1 N-acetylmuramidase family protein [Lysobacter capsici]